MQRQHLDKHSVTEMEKAMSPLDLDETLIQANELKRAIKEASFSFHAFLLRSYSSFHRQCQKQ
uniref:Uncharacterized protein n=1 Tax=Setaria italica TaxID=4555 RepID=K3YKP2_SETIT